MKQFTTVLKFEYLSYLKNKTFRIITVLAVLLIAVALSFPSITQLFKTGQENSQSKDPSSLKQVMIVDQTGYYSDAALYTQGTLSDYHFAIEPEQNLDSLKEKIKNGDLFAALIIDTPLHANYYQKQILVPDLQLQLADLLKNAYSTQKMTAYGLTESEVMQVIQVPVLDAQEVGKGFEQTYFYTYILLFLLYVSMMMYGQLVATSVATEKSSRAMELLITSAKPLNLMFGKIIGSGLAGLTQMAVFILTAAGFYQLNAESWADNAIVQSIFNVPTNILLFSLICYILGYFLYAFMFGALGSLASRVEDINTTSMPLILFFMVGFFISFMGLLHPTALTTVASFIPFFAPMVMFARISMEDVPLWQITISLLGTLLTSILCGWLGAKIYRIGILLYGNPPKLGELVKAMRNEKKY